MPKNSPWRISKVIPSRARSSRSRGRQNGRTIRSFIESTRWVGIRNVLCRSSTWIASGIALLGRGGADDLTAGKEEVTFSTKRGNPRSGRSARGRGNCQPKQGRGRWARSGLRQAFGDAESAATFEGAPPGGVPRYRGSRRRKEVTSAEDQPQRHGATAAPAFGRAGAARERRSISTSAARAAAAPARSRSARRFDVAMGGPDHFRADGALVDGDDEHHQRGRDRDQGQQAGTEVGAPRARRRAARIAIASSAIRKGQPSSAQAMPPRRRPRAAPSTTRCR